MTPTQKAAMEQALEEITEYSEKTIYVDWEDEVGRKACCEVVSYHRHDIDCTVIKTIATLRAALAETAEPVAGWKLVPVSLTQDMADSAKFVDGRLSVWKYADVYRAILNAAPQPPAPAVPPPFRSTDACAEICERAKLCATCLKEINGESAPVVELTDEELTAVIREVGKGSALRPMDRQPTSLRIARAAIAAHEQKRSKP